MAKLRKDRIREIILEYIGDPSNDFPTRSYIAVSVVGFKHHATLYNHFTPQELCEIETQGLARRREKYAPELSKVDMGLLQKAADGDAQAAKLCYQRFEGWTEKALLDVGVTLSDVLSAFPAEIQTKIKEAISKKIG